MSYLIPIQIRKGAASLWTSTNPVLLAGELGYELDTGKLKIGDGTTAWNDLGYFGGQAEIIRTAGENIVGGRAVILQANQVYHFNKDTASHYGRVVGISKGSATTGTDVTIAISGLVNGLAGLTPDALVYGGNTGAITNTAPATGISQILGVSLTADTILIEQKQPIIKQ